MLARTPPANLAAEPYEAYPGLVYTDTSQVKLKYEPASGNVLIARFRRPPGDDSLYMLHLRQLDRTENSTDVWSPTSMPADSEPGSATNLACSGTTLTLIVTSVGSASVLETRSRTAPLSWDASPAVIS